MGAAMWVWVQFWGGPSWGSCVLVWSSSILLPGLGRLVKVKIHVWQLSGPLDTRCRTYGLKSLEISPQNRPVKSLPLQKSLENCGHSIPGTSRARGAGVLPLGLSSTPLLRGVFLCSLTLSREDNLCSVHGAGMLWADPVKVPSLTGC